MRTSHSEMTLVGQAGLLLYHTARMHIFYKDVCELQVLYFPNDVWYAIWNRKAVGACDAPSSTYDPPVVRSCELSSLA